GAGTRYRDRRRVAGRRVERVRGRVDGRAERRAVGTGLHRQGLGPGTPRRGRRQVQGHLADAVGGAQVHLQPLGEGAVGALPVGVRVAVGGRGGRLGRVHLAAGGGRPAGGDVGAGTDAAAGQAHRRGAVVGVAGDA